MKRLAILLSALLWLQTAASGAEPWFRYFSDGHAVIKQGSLYGFADRNGAEVIPCRYTKAYPFNDGIAMVRQGYEVFAIDPLGNRIGPRVKIPQFYNQDFEYFVRWVCSRLPFVSDNEYAQLRSEVVNAVVTIGIARSSTPWSPTAGPRAHPASKDPRTALPGRSTNYPDQT